MKKHLTYLSALLILTIYSCATSTGLSRRGTAEKAFVESFLMEMQLGNVDSLMNYMSPKFLKRAKPPEDAVVNIFMIEGFEIEDYNKDYGYVTAVIWGKNRDWEHRLTFQVVKENDRLYLWSEDKEFEYAYINPWIHVESYINIKDGTIDKKE